jgi:hypothetical protein
MKSTPPSQYVLPEVPEAWKMHSDFTKPLNLLNPLDYIKLLYWTFFKPQFIRDYVKWVLPESNKIDGIGHVWKFLIDDFRSLINGQARQETHQYRMLLLQTLILVIGIVLFLPVAWLLQKFLPISFFFIPDTNLLIPIVICTLFSAAFLSIILESSFGGMSTFIGLYVSFSLDAYFLWLFPGIKMILQESHLPQLIFCIMEV